MTKQEQFLWIVQTTLLTNSINVSTQDNVDDNRDVISATGVLPLAGEAIRASELIPDDLGATDAAFEFCTYMFRNLRDQSRAAGDELKLPDWFAR